MAPRTLVPLLALALSMAVWTAPAAATGGSAEAESVTITEGFEDGLEPWEEDFDLPDDPNDPGDLVEYEIAVSDERANSGDRSALFFLDGRQDDGTIWLVRAVPVEPGVSYDASLEAWAWSLSESFNHLADVVLYLGDDPPSDEDSFPRTVSDGDLPLGIREALNLQEGWRLYGFDSPGVTFQDDTAFVAVGISVVWETEVSYWVDDVRLQLDPAEATSCPDACPDEDPCPETCPEAGEDDQSATSETDQEATQETEQETGQAAEQEAGQEAGDGSSQAAAQQSSEAASQASASGQANVDQDTQVIVEVTQDAGSHVVRNVIDASTLSDGGEQTCDPCGELSTFETSRSPEPDAAPNLGLVGLLAAAVGALALLRRD